MLYDGVFYFIIIMCCMMVYFIMFCVVLLFCVDVMCVLFIYHAMCSFYLSPAAQYRYIDIASGMAGVWKVCCLCRPSQSSGYRCWMITNAWCDSNEPCDLALLTEPSDPDRAGCVWPAARKLLRAGHLPCGETSAWVWVSTGLAQI